MHQNSLICAANHTKLSHHTQTKQAEQQPCWAVITHDIKRFKKHSAGHLNQASNLPPLHSLSDVLTRDSIIKARVYDGSRNKTKATVNSYMFFISCTKTQWNQIKSNLVKLQTLIFASSPAPGCEDMTQWELMFEQFRKTCKRRKKQCRCVFVSVN